MATRLHTKVKHFLCGKLRSDCWRRHASSVFGNHHHQALASSTRQVDLTSRTLLVSSTAPCQLLYARCVYPGCWYPWLWDHCWLFSATLFVDHLLVAFAYGFPLRAPAWLVFHQVVWEDGLSNSDVFWLWLYSKGSRWFSHRGFVSHLLWPL